MSRSLKIAFGLIGAVFVVFFIGMYHFVHTAFQQYEPPVEESYYEKGLDYQKRVNEFERAKAAGWSMDVNIFSAKNVSMGTYSLKILLSRDPSKGTIAAVAEDQGRLAAKVLVSHRASMKDSRSFEFKLADFKKSGENRLELDRDIEVPLSGKVDVAVEVRPAADSAIYQAKTLTVQ